MSSHQTLSERVRALTLARFFPVVGILCIAAVVTTFSLVNFKVSDNHDEVLKDFDQALSANLNALDHQVKSLASNDLIINSLIDFSNRDSYLPVFFRSLAPVHLSKPDAIYSIVFLDFEGRVIAGKNTKAFESIADKFAWLKPALEDGLAFRSLSDEGILFVHPVIYGPTTEGAVALYVEHIRDIISFNSNDLSLYLVGSDSVLYRSNTAPAVQAQELNEHAVDGVISQKTASTHTVFVTQSYVSAYSEALWIAIFVFIALVMVILALLFAIRVSSNTASAIINRLREQVAHAASAPESFRDLESNGTEAREIADLRVTFNSLMNALLNTTFAKDQVEGIIESLDEMIVVFDPKMQTMMSNESFDTFYNATAIASEQDKGPLDLFPSSFVVARELDKPEIITTPLRGGKCPRTISWHRTLYTDADGLLIGIVLAGVDITETQQMQRELSIKNKAIDEAQTPIIITDAGTQGFPITYVNKAFEQQTGYTADEVFGRGCSFLQGPDTNEADKQAIRDALNSSSPITVEILNYRKDGSTFYNRLVLTPLVNERSEVTHVIGFQQDITNEHQTKQYLESAKAEAEASAKLKSEFLASMSHEIRTPMNGILGMLGLVENTALTKEQAQHIKLAKSSADALLVLINDILDFSKIEAGKLSLESVSFDLINLISDVASSMACIAEEKNLEIILDTSALSIREVKGDPGRLRQVLNNLIGNAIKFTERGYVLITASITETNDTCTSVALAITDTGVGIPSDRIDKVFESFSQVDASTTRKFGGTGLGLTICKQLAELMDGDIKVVSTEGEGSTFTLSASFTGCSTETPSHDFAGKRVALVEASKQSALAIENQCTRWGIDIDVFADGDSAIDTISSGSYDAVLLSRYLKNTKIVDLINTIQQGSAKQAIKVCLLTRMTQLNELDEYSELNIDSFIPKPVTQNELSDVLRSLSLSHTSTASAKELSPQASDANISLDGMRVLLVEDNPINQVLAVALLEALGLSVAIANHGKEAVDMLSQDEGYELVFMDCQMPEMDGYEATHCIREGECGESYQDIPIIAMTANAIDGDREKCLDAGMSDYISKPIDTEILHERVAHWARHIKQ